MKRVLLTGAGSCTGRHLAHHLAGLADPPHIVGSDLRAVTLPGGKFRPADITRRTDLVELIAAETPDTIFHLAAAVSPDSDLCFAVNLEGTRNLLHACAAAKTFPTLVMVSSAAVYGRTRAQESPVKESTPLRPVSPYGASKAAAELAALTVAREHAAPVVVARPFNLIGHGLRPGLAPSDFAKQIVAIRDQGAEPVMQVGNLEPRRDFLDIGDAVEALVALAQHPETHGEVFNLGTGRPVRVGDLLTRLLKLAGVQAEVRTRQGLVRAGEVDEQVADIAAISRATGWKPRAALDDSLRALLTPPA